jgi:hypothetical protein
VIALRALGELARPYQAQLDRLRQDPDPRVRAAFEHKP